MLVAAAGAVATGLLSLAPAQPALGGIVSIPFFTIDGSFTGAGAFADFGIGNDIPASVSAGSDVFSPGLTLFEGGSSLVLANGSPSPESSTLTTLTAPPVTPGTGTNRLRLNVNKGPTNGHWTLDLKSQVDLQNPQPTLLQLNPISGAGARVDQIRFGVTPVDNPALPGNPPPAPPQLHLSQPGPLLANTRLILENAANLIVDADAIVGEIRSNVTSPIYAGQNAINVPGTLRVGSLNTDSAFLGTILGNHLTKIGTGTLTIAQPEIDLEIAAGTLDIHAPGSDVVPNVISGGATLRVSAGNLQANSFTNPFAGKMIITGEGLASGVFPGIGAIEVQPGGKYRGFGNPALSQVNPNAQMILAGGTLELLGINSNSAETFPTAVPMSGASTINVDSLVAGSVTTLTISSLGQRSPGATVNFTGNNLGVGSRIIFTNPPPAGFIGGWATAGGVDFAKYTAANGVVPFSAADYSPNFSSGVHALVNQSNSALPNASPLTIKLDASGQAVNLTQPAGTVVNVALGGFLKVGANPATLSGGNLTSGTSDLIVNVTQGSFTIGSKIVGNISLTKVGDDDLILNGAQANTYTGSTFVNNGRLILSKQSLNGAIPGSVFVNGGILRSVANEQINDNANVVVNPGGRLTFVDVDETIGAMSNNGGVFNSGGGALTIGNALFGPNGTNRIQALGAPAPPVPGGPVAAGPITGFKTVTALVISGGDNTIDNGATLNVKSGGLTFTGGSNPSLRLADTATLKLEGDVFVSCTGTATIGPIVSPPSTGGTIDLAAGTRTLNVDPNGTLEIGSVITNGTLIKSGGGLLRLTKASTYTGGTTVTGGTVEASVPGAFGTGPVVFAGGGLAFNTAGSPALNYIMSVNADMTVAVDAANLTSPAPGSAGMNTLAMDSSRVTLTGPGNDTITFSGTSSLNGTSTLSHVPSVTLSGAILQGAPGAGLTKEGSGTLTLAGNTSNTYTGLTRVNEGTLILAKTGGATAVAGNLTIATGSVALNASNQIVDSSAVNLLQASASLVLNTYSETVGSLTVTNGNVTLATNGATKSVLRTGSLTVTGTGFVDIANNGLIVDYAGASPLTTIAGYVQSMKLKGANAVGYGEASRLFNLSGTQTASWMGQTVDATSVLARNTLPGDATLDATVDFNDLVKLAQNYNVVGGMSWVDGDFNSDFSVDFNDLVLLAQNYNTSLPGGALPVPGAPAGFDADVAAAFASVPEPSLCAPLAACGFALFARRRRSRDPRMDD